MFHSLKANGKSLRLLSAVRESTVYVLTDSVTGKEIRPEDGVLAISSSLNVTISALKTAGFRVEDCRR